MLLIQTTLEYPGRLTQRRKKWKKETGAAPVDEDVRTGRKNKQYGGPGTTLLTATAFLARIFPVLQEKEVEKCGFFLANNETRRGKERHSQSIAMPIARKYPV